MKSLVLILAWAGTAVAQAPPMRLPAIQPNLIQPDPAVLIGKSCVVRSAPSILYKGQDLNTNYWIGIAFVTVTCADDHTVRQGCADLSWDPTGTTISYKARFQEVIEDPFKSKDAHKTWFKDVKKRCFDNDIHFVYIGQ